MGRSRECFRRGAVMKPINAFPLIMLLIAVLFLVYWLRPH
jgi:hypothetical protein